jgi:uncharacterized membrane-anchored protein
LNFFLWCFIVFTVGLLPSELNLFLGILLF